MNNTLSQYKKYPFLIILIVSLWLCEGFFGLFHLSRLLFVIYFIALFVCYDRDSTYSKPLLTLYISMALSMLSCWYFHGQTLFSSITEYVTYGAIAIYFVLLKMKISPIIIERVIFWMFLLFCFCYLYQMMIFPKAVFITKDTNVNSSLDIILRRIRMPGMSLVGLGLFYCLNKILLGKLKYLPFLVLAIVILLLFGFRTLLFFSILFSLWMVIKVYGISRKFLLGTAFIIILVYGFSKTSFGEETFDAMLQRQDADQTFANKDYIRYTTLFYYYEQHFTNIVEYLLGSGIPARRLGGNYVAYYERLESLGIHYYDWGILGMSWMMGVLSLIAMLWYSIKAFLTKLPKDKMYLTIWFGYLLACGFTSAEFVRQGCFFIQGIVLYIIYAYEKNCGRK